MGWLLSMLPFGLSPAYKLLQRFPGRVFKLPFRLFPAYSLLQRFSGRVFKEVGCVVLTKVPGLHDELAAFPSHPRGERSEIIELCDHFRLERRDGNRLFINGQMSYYITGAMWQILLTMGEILYIFVYLKGIGSQYRIYVI
jgi:hypothetical protein